MKYLMNLFVLLISTVIAVPVFAGCPAGKVQVTVTTNSGKTRILCIGDAALSGIENATDYSDGTIIPSACPCWNESDIKYYEEAKMLSYCDYYNSTLDCVDSTTGAHVLYANRVGTCANYVTGRTYDRMSDENWNSCYTLVERFVQ